MLQVVFYPVAHQTNEHAGRGHRCLGGRRRGAGTPHQRTEGGCTPGFPRAATLRAQPRNDAEHDSGGQDHHAGQSGSDR